MINSAQRSLDGHILTGGVGGPPMESSQEFSVAPYEERYMDCVRDLWKERFEPGTLTKRETLFEWLTEQNPFAFGESPYFMLLHHDRVVGMHGHMPVLFSIYGKTRKGYLAHDDLIAQDYRGKGLGRLLLKGVQEQTKLFAGALWFNEPNYRSYYKCGWLDVPNFYSYVFVLNPRVVAEKIFNNRMLVDAASRLVSPLLRILEKRGDKGHMAKIHVSEFEQFDADFDRFYARVAHHFGIMAMRNQQYLNWKFVTKPFNNYKRYAAFDQTGELSGYMVLKKETVDGGVRGRILDILADPAKPDVFSTLILGAIREFTEVSADYIEITCTYPFFQSLLRRSGFFRSRTPRRLMALNWEVYFPQEFVENVQNWFITESDADGDAWSIDTLGAW